MKLKILHISVSNLLVFVAFIFALFITSTVNAANNRFSVATGTWNSTSTWAAFSGGAAGASVPVAGDAVTIELGFTVTVDINTAACASVQLGGTGVGSDGTLAFNSGSILTVSGTVTLGNGGVRTGSLDFTSGGLLQIGNALTVNKLGTFTPGTGTIEYNMNTGAGQIVATTASLVNAYNNLTLSGSGTKATSSVTVNGILSMEGSATVSAAPTYGSAATLQYNTAISHTAGYEWITPFIVTGGVKIANTGTITLNNAKVFSAGSPLTVQSGATLDMSTFLLTLNGDLINNGGSASGTGNVAIAGTATQSIGSFTTTGTVSMTKTGGTATFTGNVNGAGLTINGSGGTLNLGAGLTHTFTGTWTRSAGTLDGGSSKLRLGAGFSGTASTFTASTGTVEWYAAGVQTCAVETYNNLTLSGSGIKTFFTSPTVNGILSMEGTATVIVTGAAIVTYGPTATLKYNTATARTVTAEEWITPFNATGGVIIDNTGTITLDAAKTFGNSVPLTINSGAKLNAAAFANTFGTSATVTINGLFQTANTFGFSGGGSTAITNVNTPTITLGASSTVEYTLLGGGQTVTGITYNGNLKIDNTSGTNTAGGAITVNGTFTTTAFPGTVGSSLDMVIYALSASTVSHNGILKTQNTSSTPLTSGKTWGGTVEYNATTGGQTIMSATYNNLILDHTSGTNTASGNINVDGILDLRNANPSTTTGYLDMSSYILTMGEYATTTGIGDVTGIVQRTTISPDVVYTFGNQYTTMSLAYGETMPLLISFTITIGTVPGWSTGAVKRQYDINRTAGSAATKVILSLHYLDGELNGNDENKLSLYDNSASDPGTDLGRSNRNTANDWVELANISFTYFPTSSGLKYWTLRNSAATVVTWTGATSSVWALAGNWDSGIPVPGSNVVIPDVSTNDPTLPASTTINSLEILSGGILSDGGGSILTINGAAGAWMNGGGSSSFVKGTSTIHFTNADATMAGETDFYNVEVATGAALTLGTNNTMRIGGTLTLTGTGVLNAGTTNNTVEYNGGGQTVIKPNGLNPGYHNLILSGSSTKTMPGSAMDIHGTFALSGTASASAGEALTIGGNVTLGSGTTFNASSFTHKVAGDWTNFGGTFTPGSSVIDFNGTTTQTINGTASSQTFNNLIVEKSENTILTLSGNTTTLTVQDFTETSGNFAAPATFNINGNAIIDAGTFFAGSGTIYLVGNFTNNSIFTAESGTVNFKSGSAQNISGTGLTNFNNLTISNSSYVTLLRDIGVVGDLNIGSGSTFDLLTYTCNRSLAGGIMTVAGTMRLGGITGGQTGSNFPLNFGTMTMTGGTVEYNGTAAQTVYNDATGLVYNNLIISNNVLAFLTGNLQDITGNLTINADAKFDLRTFTCNRSSGGGIMTVAGTMFLGGSSGGQTGSNFPLNFGTMTMTGGTVNYNGILAQTVYNGATYNNLVISNIGIKSLTGNLPNITGDLTITSDATFDLRTFTANHTATGGTLQVDGIMKLGANTGGEAGSNFPINYSSRVLSTGSTVEYHGSNSITQTIYSPAPSETYYNLTLTNGTGSGTAAKTITANLITNHDLTINLGAQFVVPVLLDVTVGGTTAIKSPQGLYLHSDATGFASFIDNGTITYATGGTATVELYLTECLGSDPYKCWHYVSSPISNAVSGVFFGDYLKWYDTSIPDWSSYYTLTTEPLGIMKGWAVSEQVAPGSNHNFIGLLNTGISAKSLVLTTTSPASGWNLVGNPYPSAIDFDLVPVWTNVEQIIWYLNQSTGNYEVYPDQGTGATGSRYIPNMQGVFVHANGTDPSITFPNSARVHDHSHLFYKELQAPNDIDVLYLKAQGTGKESYDLASIVFRDYTTRNYDNNYDALKLYGGVQAPQLFTASDDNADLTINSLPFAGRNTTVPLNFTVFENGAGTYTITASNLESFRSGTTIILEDKKESKTQELIANPVYNFNYTDGDNPARFLLHFYNPFYGINDSGRNDDMQIYSNGNDIYVKDFTGNPVTGDLFIYNMLGQEMTHKPVAGISLNKYTFSLPDGYYIVRVITKDKTYNSKIYLD